MKKICYFFGLLLSSCSITAQTWTAYTLPFGDTVGIADVEVVNENVIWAVGLKYGVDDSLYYYGFAYETYYAVTADGGATWKVGTIPMGANPFIANMAATDAGTAMVIGLSNFGDAKTLKTVDGGATWQTTPNNWDPVASWPDYIHAFTPAKYVVLGDPRDGEFEIYNTLNAGQVWQRIPGANIADPISGEFGFNNCGDASGNSIWFGTNVGRVYRSTNSGLNWEASQTPLPSVGIMDFADANHGVVSSGYGNIFVSRLCTTSDGGATWTELNNLPNNGDFLIFGISYIPNQPYIVVGLTMGGNLTGPYQTWLSRDRGNSWQQISSGEIIGWPEFINSTTGWAGEFQQLAHPTRLYKYSGSPLVGLFTPATLEADVTLAPNPASDFIRLQAKLSRAAEAMVLIHDVSGKLLFQETLPVSLQIDKNIPISTLPAGDCWITISTAEGSLTRPVLISR